MLYADIQFDLPSEELLRRRTPLDWLAELIGREPDRRSGEELTTVTGLSVFKHLTDAFMQQGITDVLSVAVDGKAAYVDTDENSGDLSTAVAELDARRALEDPLDTMELVLSHRADGLHTLIQVHLRRRMPAGSSELVIAVAARLDSMQVQRGEDPSGYAERLRCLADDSALLEAARERLATLTRSAKLAIEQQLGELVVSSSISPVTLRLIRPGPRALDHFRRLTWGASVRMPKYRPVPIRTRQGAYDEPFYHHYFDPYFDFVAWITIEAIVAGQGWRGLEFEVVDADGQPAFTHDDCLGQAAIAGEYEGLEHGAASVAIVDDALVVNSAVPELNSVDPGEIGDPRLIVGYAGDGHADEGTAGANWNETSLGVSGDDMGGSCGASCGGCGGCGA